MLFVGQNRKKTLLLASLENGCEKKLYESDASRFPKNCFRAKTSRDLTPLVTLEAVRRTKYEKVVIFALLETIGSPKLIK